MLGLLGTAIALGAGYLVAKVVDLRRIFGRYVTDSVVATLLETPEGLRFGGKRCEVTILMSDLRGFSAISEYLPPEEVVELLNLYFEVMTETIAHYDGTINEFIGDAILVFFGAPNPDPKHAERGVACAVAMQLAMEEVNQKLNARGLPSLEMGIGLNTGEVVVGNVGSSRRAKWTAIGSHINLAARIESYTAGRQILVSWETLVAAGESVKVEQQRSVKPKGFKNPINIYEITGIRGNYNLFLPEIGKQRVVLPEAIAIAFTIVQGKDVGKEAIYGEMVELSTSSAKVQADVVVEPLSNLLITLCDRPEAGDLYAKVLESHSDGFSIRFTAVPPILEEFLFACVHASR